MQNQSPSGSSPADTALTAVEQRVLAAIDEQALVGSLIDLVQLPSITGSAEESHAQHVQGRRYADLGFDVDLWKFDLDELRADPGFPGTEVDRAEGYGMVATRGPAGVPAFVLQGHVDVVPTGDRAKWEGRDPFGAEVIGRTLHGRGACDMKAGVAANLAVAAALTSAGVVLERPFAVHCVVSEEDGGLGAFATLRRGHRGDAAVIPEPTGGRIITANAGALTFRLEVPGRAAHGSVRLEGVSAFDAYLPLYRAIVELEAERNVGVPALFADYPLPYGISIGRISSGDWASSVSDLLVAQGRMGVKLGEDPAAARQELADRIAAAGAADPWLADHPATLTWPGGQFASGMLEEAHPLIGEMQAAVVGAGGIAPSLSAAPYGSDMRLYTGIGGIPTLHYGPGEARHAHSPREQVDLDDLLAATRALALLAVRRLDAHL